ncbi:PTS sugar transporter subunit IIC [uncultured Clostridium sp.]|uniref:PTS sugar transporter subunit IIC n=1 Tax=uncultured Clostridium sp. TaxID=59620 RepID=UPI0026342E9F|nr:PTS sugar transporter subunit IIC [uncultured Clostridium sp.]
MNNKIMDKVSAKLEAILLPIAGRLAQQKHVMAIRDAFILIFPLTMAASLMLLLNFTILAPDGFIASLLRLHQIFPGLAEYQAVFSPVLKGSTDIMALLITFLVAKELARSYELDDIMIGLTSLSVFMIVYPNYVTTESGNALITQYMGAQGLFVAIIIALCVTELMKVLTRTKKLEIQMPEQVPPAVMRSFKVLIPIILVTVLFAVGNFILMKFVDGGLHDLVYSTIQKPLTLMGTSIWSVIILALVSNFLWVLGIHGPNTIAAIRDTMFAEAGAANIKYVAEHGTAWGAPYPVTWALNDAFANAGGSGVTLGLIIAIFIFSKRQEYKEIAKLSIAPGCFNINEPVIFGLPVVLNPMLMIPFIIVPLINILIGYFCIMAEIIPPVVYGVPWTTPGPIIAFLGTGGNYMALVVGILCLIVSIIVYTPFVIASNKVQQGE